MKYSIALEFTRTGTTQQKLEAINTAGFEYINIHSRICLTLIRETIKELENWQNELLRTGLKIDWVHAPFEIPQIYSLDNELYSLSIGAIKQVIDYAYELSANTVVMHPYNPLFPEDLLSDKYVNQLVNGLTILSEYARKKNIYLALENLLEEPQSKKLLTILFDRVSELYFCFDTGHAHICKANHEYLPHFIKKIKALHIHDNDQ